MVEKKPDLVVGMTGASGSIVCVNLLQILRQTSVRTHLVVSKWGAQTLKHEAGLSMADLRELADHSYSDQELGATISSGSFPTLGMVVVPCSMKALGCIANGVGPGLVHRAADVTLKERRPLVLAAREAPLNEIHLENMLKVGRAGATIFPLVPAFYALPQSIDDLVDHMVSRILDQFGIEHAKSVRWAGMSDGGAGTSD